MELIAELLLATFFLVLAAFWRHKPRRVREQHDRPDLSGKD